MTRRHLEISDELWHWVSVEAARQGKYKKDIVEEALKEYRDRREQEHEEE